MAYVTALDTTDLQFGKNIWQALRLQGGFEWNGIFWLLDPEAEQWHLVVATPLLDRLGPRRAYTMLTDLIQRVPATGDQLLRITLISPKDPLYASLQSVFAQTASVEGLRLGNTYIGNVVVPEAYLYEVR